MRALLAASVPEVLDCGDGVRLLAHHATQAAARAASRPRALAVLLHGWEGSASSLYVLSLGQYLLDRGFDVVRLNLRDHGDSHHLNPEIFHSCRIAEVVGAVQRLQALHPGQALHLAGFSLGGNFCLRVAARAAAAGLDLAPGRRGLPRARSGAHAGAARAAAGRCTGATSSGSGAARCARSRRRGRSSTT